MPTTLPQHADTSPNQDLYYQIAFSLLPEIGPARSKALLHHFNVDEVFKAKKSELAKIEGIGPKAVAAITTFDNFKQVEDEMLFCEKYDISPLFITHPKYPQRLLHCYDPPPLLYFKGNADLNHPKIISIIGTRACTDYGREITERLVAELAPQKVLVVSGLAYGIDGIAHRAAVLNKLPTIGVLAHGLDIIYPTAHKTLAKEMLQQGGLLTEFCTGTPPDRPRFPIRNRIVAGMSDATIVIETEIKGGSMITARLAANYNKEVFALPGKTTDIKSSGCHYLIKNNTAQIFTDADDIIGALGWKKTSKQQMLNFEEKYSTFKFTPNEKIIFDLLRNAKSMPIDEINYQSEMKSSEVAAAILNLELNNIVKSLPGKSYQLI